MIAHKLVIECILDVACERRAGGRTLPPVPGSVEDGRRQMRFTPTGKCADIAKVGTGVQRVSTRVVNQTRLVACILVRPRIGPDGAPSIQPDGTRPPRQAYRNVFRIALACGEPERADALSFTRQKVRVVRLDLLDRPSWGGAEPTVSTPHPSKRRSGPRAL